MSSTRWLMLFLFSLLSTGSIAYPLDGRDYTGVQRLEGFRLAQQGKATGRVLPEGAGLNLDQVDLRLADGKERSIPAPDSEFTHEVENLMGRHRQSLYGLAVLDLTDPDHPAYAEHRADVHFNPGSVGKLAAVLGIFHELATIYPDSIADRERVLRESQVTADDFIISDHHVVPFWQPEKKRVLKRRLRQGDRANLWTYLDWMLSASSNAAASMVIQQLMLLHAYGKDYPVSNAEKNAFFKRPRSELASILRASLDGGVKAAGLDLANFKQGGFFTSGGKRHVPGGGSTATPRELMRLLFKLERGKVFDRFSSREIKRLLYMTQRRIRFASSPALRDAAVYFKSGSLYRCKKEPGFVCGKYKGSVINLLNSVAIVEYPAGDENGLYYMAVVTSNILKLNAAVEHQTLATRLHRLIQRRHAPAKQGKAGKK